MRVRGLTLVNVMRHRHTRLDFPERGLVVVRGANGAGKSSLIEAVALARSGKTLRGTKAWAGDNGQVILDAEGLTIDRVRKGGKAHLYWRLRDDGTAAGQALDALARLGGLPTEDADNEDGSFKWESTAHAQAGLDKVIGSFDLWRRRCVFSSSDAAHFSLAGDRERKLLLEAVLGLDAFDGALEACRKDLKAARDAQTRALLASERATASVASAATHVEDLTDAAMELEELPPAPASVDATEGERLRASDAAVVERLRTLRSRGRDLDQRAATADAELRRRHAELIRLDVDACSGCGQGIPADLVRKLQEGVTAARAEAERVRAEVVAARGALDEEVEEAEADRSVFQQRLATFEQRKALAASQATARSLAEARRASADARLAEGVKALDEARQAAQAALRAAEGESGAVLLLEACEQVLGLRGVRAHLLGESLAGISAVANAWLPRLGSTSDLRVTLRPYSEKKTGGQTDAISIEVEGVEHGEGYRGCSAGERRRVDVALLLGMGEVALPGMLGDAPTLFFDELFDGLDADGVTAASAALSDLARDRLVVVITHNDDLAAQIAADVRLHVDKGEVR